MRFIYDFLFAVYVAVYLPILVLRRKWHSGFRERFGFFAPETSRSLAATKNIWVHAVSVGEVAVVEGIINGLRRHFPDHRIVLTVTTRTGYSFARRKYRETATVLWSPLDFSLVVDSFARVISPVFYIAAETELWPNLFRRLAQDNVKIMVVNGRISDEAFPRYQWVRLFLKTTLARVALFAMQSRQDADRILALGASSAKVRVAGNVKFDAVSEPVAAVPADYGLDKVHQVLLAGSTHPGEEKLLLDIFCSLKVSFEDLRLVLAPRHPERASSVASLVAGAGLKPVLFSGNKAIIARDEVLVVDTIGHLAQFYSLASVVFVGKSLTAKGGHNIIEPAVFGKPVVIGPLMNNFRDITQAFTAENAVIQVQDAMGLKSEVRRLLEDPQAARELGDRARMVVRRHRGATVRILDMINVLLRKS